MKKLRLRARVNLKRETKTEHLDSNSPLKLRPNSNGPTKRNVRLLTNLECVSLDPSSKLRKPNGSRRQLATSASFIGLLPAAILQMKRLVERRIDTDAKLKHQDRERCSIIELPRIQRSGGWRFAPRPKSREAKQSEARLATDKWKLET